MSKSSPKIGFICGSLRKGSINQKLSQALQTIARQKGLIAEDIDLGAYDLPIFHGDLETPPGVKTLIEDIKTYAGVVIVTPEYNGGLPPVLKNAIDWTTTVETGHISNKVYGVASCVPGALSGVMVMRELQFLLMRLGADLVATQTGCANAGTAFNDGGDLIAERVKELAEMMFDQMISRISQQR